jgi:hypothetical protein
VDLPAPFSPRIATREERVSEHETSLSDGLELPGYVYETFVILKIVRVCDLIPERIPGGGKLKCAFSEERV